MDNIFKKFVSPSNNQHSQKEKMTSPQNSDMRNRSSSVIESPPTTPTQTSRKTSVDQDTYFYFM